MKTWLGAVLVLLCTTGTAVADIQWSGYGSLVVGKTIGGDPDPTGEVEFPVDFYDYAFYQNEWSMEPESMIALQARMDVMENLTFTAQLVAKGADDFSPDIDWLYATYRFSDDLYLMLGRRNLPMYYFSEYMEVGFAYPWVRPPANLYWWEITQFNGATLVKDFMVEDWNFSLSGFVGHETQKNIKSHDFWRNRGGYYFPPEGTYIAGTADVTWSKIMGANLAASNDWIDLRLSYFRTFYETFADVMFFDELDLDGDGVTDQVVERRTNPDGTPIRSGASPLTEFDLDFFGASGSFNFTHVTLLFDYNYVMYDDGYGSRFPTYLLTAIYNHDVWQPYIGMSQALLKITEDYQGFGTGEAEEHRMVTVGLKYNFHPNASLKVQYDDFQDSGDRLPWYDFSYHNDARLFSVALDFVF